MTYIYLSLILRGTLANKRGMVDKSILRSIMLRFQGPVGIQDISLCQLFFSFQYSFKPVYWYSMCINFMDQKYFDINMGGHESFNQKFGWM